MGRKAASVMAVHDTTVDAMHVPYIHPSENGGRADVQWIEYASKEENDRRIKILYCFDKDEAVKDEFFYGDDLGIKEPEADKRPRGMKGAQVSVSRYSVEQLTNAKHQTELPDVSDETPVYVNVDTAQQGLGGDCSWKPVLHKQYRVRGAKWKYSLVLKFLLLFVYNLFQIP